MSLYDEISKKYESEKVDIPKQIIEYYYYENKKCFGPFDKKPNKRLTERFFANKDEIKKAYNHNDDIKSKVLKEWKTELRKKYKFLTDAQFNLCYSKAYEHSHSEGFHAVEGKLVDVVDFVEDILNTI